LPAKRFKCSNSAWAQWSLFREAETVKAGTKGEKWATLLTSAYDPPDVFTYSGIAFEPDSFTTVSDLTYLGTEVAADIVGGGSPRFQITLDVDTDGNGFNDVDVEKQDSGNLVDSEELRFDTTQIGGTFYDSYENAADLAGDAEILAISLVADAGWFAADGEKGKRLGHYKK
jgi:hypothetical protein